MPIQELTIREFSGGLATVGEKRDKANSAKFIKNLDIFEDPSYITLSKKTAKVSGDIVTDLPYWMDDGSPFDTNRYVYGSSGNVYKVTSADTFSVLFDASGGAGEGLRVFDDYLYYATATDLGRYGILSGTPANSAGFLANGVFDLDRTGGGTGAADYVPPVAVDEGADDRQTFTPTTDPLKKIYIDVDVVGSGNWTITVHDVNNKSLGTSTTANGDMVVGWNTFVFSSAVRVVIGNEYHFHVTSTVADGGVDTETATDLEGAAFKTTFGILIDSAWHPMVTVEDTLIIGNERYLATWDQATYHPNRIALEPGFTVRSIARFEEFIVAAAYKGGSVSDAEAARLYFWDAVVASTTVSYDFFKEVTVGVPNAVHNSSGRLVGVYGHSGEIYRDHSPFKKVTGAIPKLERGKKVEIFPGAITEYEGKTLVGVSGSTDDSTGLEQGVYQYGKQHELLPEAMNFPFTVSTGTTQGTTLQVGCVKSFGTDLYVGWRDDTAYGLDKVSLGGDAFASGSFESLIFDGGDPDSQFAPTNLKITFAPLTAGQSVTPKYKLNREASFTNGDAASTVGDTRVEWPIFTRCKEIEFGFNIASTSNTYLKITSVTLEYDDLVREQLE